MTAFNKLLIFCILLSPLLATEPTAAPYESGLVSTGAYERDGSFTPGMNEFYFTRYVHSRRVILMIRKNTKRQWSTPQVAAFSGIYSDCTPCVTSEGNRIYFSSKRPGKSPGQASNFDLFYVDRKTKGTWGEVVRMDTRANSTGNEYHPTLTDKGKLYFCRSDADNPGEISIYSLPIRIPGSTATRLGNQVNIGKINMNPFIARDESYILFTSYQSGNGDIYIAYRNGNDWTRAEKLPAPINSDSIDYCPSVSPDGHYLIFSSNRKLHRDLWNKRRDFRKLRKIIRGPGNGSMDIYISRTFFLKSDKKYRRAATDRK